ncbi:SGNH/GDSL hydrolase family protein [[Mycoplasma] falconis]|uniref:SGNH/GDSL hydrolase family protein n=1 Tax=[Mycoplasma] falconis TaxID=92403 RepID=A0A501XA67_9BACT|nr:SGNH/GDSL hydrolase family protein [[Mycoplasma] falconis]TPE57273.1 SGNH/GDSL hydrolase family protein [[Mycoplasma] falconis]
MPRTFEDLDRFYAVKHKENLIEEPINYVAIGDLYASGFNSKIGFNTNSKLINGNINGLGYPDFFARLLKLNNNQLNSYYNLSLPSGNIELTEALVKNSKAELKKLSNKLDLIQSIDWDSHNVFQNYFSNIFNNWAIEKNDFSIYQKTLKEANLITISLSLEEVYTSLPNGLIFSLRKMSADFKEQTIKTICEQIDFASHTIIEKYLNLIKEIKQLNNQAKIIIVGYPMIMQDYKNIFNSFLYRHDVIKFDLFKYIFKTVNFIQKQVAKHSDVEYVDVYDEKYWADKAEYLFENSMGVFPCEKGYKKIAFDLYTKLSLDQDDLNLIKQDIHLKKAYILDFEYWQKDVLSHNKIFKNNNNKLLFERVYGNNLNRNILISDSFELAYNNQLSPYLNISDIINLFVRYGKYNAYIIAKKYLVKKFDNAPEQYESINLIIDFLTNDIHSKEVFLTFLKNGRLNKILFILQNKLRDIKLKNGYIDFKNVKTAWHEIIKNNQDLIYSVFKQFFSAGIIEKNKELIKKIFNAFVSDALNTSLLNFLFGFKNDDSKNSIRQYLSSLSSFSEFLNFIFDSIVNYANKYSKLNNFDELWKLIIVENKYNFIYNFDKIFVELSNENQIEKTSEFIYKTIISTIRMQSLEVRDYKQVKSSITKILSLLRVNTKFVNNLFIKILDKFKNVSLYDWIVNKKIPKKSSFKWINILGLNSGIGVALKILKEVLKIKAIIKKNKI